MKSRQSSEKGELRRRMLVVRAGCDPAVSGRVVTHALRFLRSGAVAGFWPLPGEIDIRPLLEGLGRRGQVVGLPSIVGRRALLFRRWWPGAEMQAGQFGIMEAVGEAVAPDVVLVPLLAFDRSGGRLGYGGGYYDATLSGRRVFALGVGFAAQQVERVPREAHDLWLDAVVTENGVMEVNRV